MSKLLTPLQYESVLDGLNDVRPLQLDKIIRPVIDIPVANRISVEGKKSVAGAFVKSTQQGGLIVKPPQGFTNYEFFTEAKTEGYSSWYVDFSQKVYKILIRHYNSVGEYFFACTNNLHNVELMDMDIAGIYCLNMVTNRIYLICMPGSGESFSYDMYGFY